ncbi:Coenzyme Q-binding protein coq10, mitochondrial [Blastocladiella emersonii ATCC 22665]|nr:Coenzyme Q-binding protein coq10, mitochondrial [Blastocladiella emersonii ATCC 22665]
MLSPKPVEYTERKMLKFTPKQLFDLVSNVNDYTHFVPYCVASEVHTVERLAAVPAHLPALLKTAPLAVRKSAGVVVASGQQVSDPSAGAGAAATPPAPPAVHQMLASLDVGFSGLRESYTSRVTCIDSALVVAEASNTSLFTTLTNVWSFTSGPVPGTTFVDFYIHFTFRSGFHAQLADMFFTQINRQTMAAFETRARALYGPLHPRAAKHVTPRILASPKHPLSPGFKAKAKTAAAMGRPADK